MVKDISFLILIYSVFSHLILYFSNMITLSVKANFHGAVEKVYNQIFENQKHFIKNNIQPDIRFFARYF